MTWAAGTVQDDVTRLETRVHKLRGAGGNPYMDVQRSLSDAQQKVRLLSPGNVVHEREPSSRPPSRELSRRRHHTPYSPGGGSTARSVLTALNNKPAGGEEHRSVRLYLSTDAGRAVPLPGPPL